MGAYINPQDMTKEDWLTRHAMRLDKPPRWEDISEGYMAVVHIDNGIFTAAGIAFCKQELEDFSRPDGRPKLWFLAEEKDLHEVSEELKEYMSGAQGDLR